MYLNNSCPEGEGYGALTRLSLTYYRKSVTRNGFQSLYKLMLFPISTPLFTRFVLSASSVGEIWLAIFLLPWHVWLLSHLSQHGPEATINSILHKLLQFYLWVLFFLSSFFWGGVGEIVVLYRSNRKLIYHVSKFIICEHIRLSSNNTFSTFKTILTMLSFPDLLGKICLQIHLENTYCTISGRQ